ncbi:complex I subunit 4 family protein [Marinicrinis sediminis]|uniref:NuoM family protein n=1 Tax=Marinicrinis sediminis TaxID=1652465 RepID=A0ABW5RAH2_9BACL
MDNLPLLSWITLSPLLGILILLFIPKDKGKWIKTIGMAAAFLPLLFTLILWTSYAPEQAGFQYEEKRTWIEVPLNREAVPQIFIEGEMANVSSFAYEFDYHLAVDGLSLPLVFLTALVSFMAAFAAMYIKKRWKSFYILFLLLQVGMFGVFLAKDLFLFFIFFEMAIIPTFFLIGIWGFMDREKAANKFLIYNGVGSAILLIAILLLVNTAGFSVETLPKTGDEPLQAEMVYHADMSVIASNLTNPDAYVNQDPESLSQNPFYMSESMKWTLFLLLLIGFGIKLPIFPFHTWMLKVHTEAPFAVVMIHSGILLKMGAYGLMRFGYGFFPEQAQDAAMVIAILGVINILYGALLAMVQKELRLVLAYSSISHMGIVLLGLAAMNAAGYEGAVLQLISHGLISALLFLIVGSFYQRTQTTELSQLGGMAKSAPFMSGLLLLAGLASLGLPGLSGFVGELLAFIGLFGEMRVLAIIAALGIVLAAVYVLRAIMAITYGPTSSATEGMKDARFAEALPMIILAGMIILIGIYPYWLIHVMEPAIQTMLSGIGG